MQRSSASSRIPYGKLQEFFFEDDHSYSNTYPQFSAHFDCVSIDFPPLVWNKYSKFAEERRVFNEIEFYLPQLAHLVIHLEEDFNTKSLERFAIVISQTSMHTALQLYFILMAAMEDYQPEKARGERNPDAKPLLFFRCSKLLHNIERAVVFGTPTLTADEETMFASQLSRAQYLELKDYEKNERVNQILTSTEPQEAKPKVAVDGTEKPMSGKLLYKKEIRTSMFECKGWKECFFRVQHRVLLCYADEKSKTPLRAISLEDCNLFTVQREKYQFQFELVSKTTSAKYQMRAKDRETYDTWMEALKR
jgi:phosphatidylinositol 4-kinase B